MSINLIYCKSGFDISRQHFVLLLEYLTGLNFPIHVPLEKRNRIFTDNLVLFFGPAQVARGPSVREAIVEWKMNDSSIPTPWYAILWRYNSNCQPGTGLCKCIRLPFSAMFFYVLKSSFLSGLSPTPEVGYRVLSTRVYIKKLQVGNALPLR